MPRMLKPGSLERNSTILKDATRDFASIERIWQENLRRTSTIGRSHRRHEQDLKSLVTLTLRIPNPCYIPMLEATIVRCHLFDVFPTVTK